jgi:acyl carrier protein
MKESPELLAGTGQERLISRLRAATPRRRSRLLMEYLQEQLGARLGLEPAEIGPRDNLMDLGMDSLKAIELKTLLEAELDLELSSSLAFDQPNLEFLTGFLLESARLTAPEAPAAPEPASPLPSSSSEPTGLSEDQLAELLAAELGDLKPPSGSRS